MSKPDIQMDASTARDIVKRINQGVKGIGEQLLRLRDQKGWAALGYKSWRECATTEFKDFSQSRLYELLQTAEVTRQISAMAETETPLTKRQTRALSVVEPEQRKEVFEEAKRRTGTDNPPASAIEEVINDLPPKQDVQDQEPPTPATARKDERLAAATSIVNGNKRLEKLAFEIEELIAHWPEMKPQVAILLRKYLSVVETNPSNVLPLERRTA